MREELIEIYAALLSELTELISKEGLKSLDIEISPNSDGYKLYKLSVKRGWHREPNDSQVKRGLMGVGYFWANVDPSVPLPHRIFDSYPSQKNWAVAGASKGGNFELVERLIKNGADMAYAILGYCEGGWLDSTEKQNNLIKYFKDPELAKKFTMHLRYFAGFIKEKKDIKKIKIRQISILMRYGYSLSEAVRNVELIPLYQTCKNPAQEFLRSCGIPKEIFILICLYIAQSDNTITANNLNPLSLQVKIIFPILFGNLLKELIAFKIVSFKYEQNLTELIKTLEEKRNLKDTITALSNFKSSLFGKNNSISENEIFSLKGMLFSLIEKHSNHLKEYEIYGQEEKKILKSS